MMMLCYEDLVAKIHGSQAYYSSQGLLDRSLFAGWPEGFTNVLHCEGLSVLP